VSARRQIAQLTSRYAIAALGLRAAIGIFILADRLELPTMHLIARRGLLAFVCSVALFTTAAFGQTPNVRYRIATAAFPAGVSRPTINDMNNLGVIVGYAGNDEAFICDLHGSILPAGLHWLDDLVQVPQDWSAVHCVGINDSGIVVGLFDRPGPTGTVRGGFGRRREAGRGEVLAARDELAVVVADLDEELVLAAVLAGGLRDPGLEAIGADHHAQLAEVLLEPVVDLLDEAVLEAREHVEDLQRDEAHDHGEDRERDAQPDAPVHGVAVST
jgi:hypothetical protein